MSCEKCGQPCKGRLCQTHRLAERGQRDLSGDAECPDCGGPTSAEGATCNKCREVDE